MHESLAHAVKELMNRYKDHENNINRAILLQLTDPFSKRKLVFNMCSFDKSEFEFLDQKVQPYLERYASELQLKFVALNVFQNKEYFEYILENKLWLFRPNKAAERVCIEDKSALLDFLIKLYNKGDMFFQKKIFF